MIMIEIAILFILTAIAVMVICVLQIKDYWENKEVTQILSCCILFLGMCAVIVICALVIRNEIIHHEDRYPASEYRIETEITTRGEVSDTTYVITRK